MVLCREFALNNRKIKTVKIPGNLSGIFIVLKKLALKNYYVFK